MPGGRVRRWSTLVVLLVVASLLAPGTARAHHATTDCPDTERCEFPTPEECAEGEHAGPWDGGPPGRGSVCAGAAGHNVAYVGGEPTQLCGAVIVADVNVVDGPTSRSSDPNA